MPFNIKDFAKGALVGGAGFVGGVARGRLSTFEMERQARLDKFSQNQALLANDFKRTQIAIDKERGALGQARLEQATIGAEEAIKIDTLQLKELERHHRETEKIAREKDTERERLLDRRDELIKKRTTATVPTIEEKEIPVLTEAEREELRAVNIQLGISPKAKAEDVTLTPNDMQVQAGKLAKSFYTEDEWEDLGIDGRVLVVNFVGEKEFGDRYESVSLPTEGVGGSAGLLGGFTTPLFGGEENVPATTGVGIDPLAPQGETVSDRYRLK